MKERNVAAIAGQPHLDLVEADLLTADLDALLEDVTTVLHFAAQPGVRASWGADFKVYSDNNILATQRLLEACKGRHDIRKVVFASSSSVYGDSKSFPQRESDFCQPVSPYGVSKLAAEQLCYLYWKSFGVPTVSLRLFTVFGPRQRPDMAFHRFIRAGLRGESIQVFGDGEQTRDFTYVDDIVQGTLAAAESAPEGRVFNLGGGNPTRLRDVLSLLEEILDASLSVEYRETQKGDMAHTVADIGAACAELGYCPSTDLRGGLQREVEWVRQLYEGAAS